MTPRRSLHPAGATPDGLIPSPDGIRSIKLFDAPVIHP